MTRFPLAPGAVSATCEFPFRIIFWQPSRTMCHFLNLNFTIKQLCKHRSSESVYVLSLQARIIHTRLLQGGTQLTWRASPASTQCGFPRPGPFPTTSESRTEATLLTFFSNTCDSLAFFILFDLLSFFFELCVTGDIHFECFFPTLVPSHSPNTTVPFLSLLPFHTKHKTGHFPLPASSSQPPLSPATTPSNTRAATSPFGAAASRSANSPHPLHPFFPFGFWSATPLLDIVEQSKSPPLTSFRSFLRCHF